MPDDPELEDMDPVMKGWMFYSWAEDYSDEFNLLENQSYLIGSFINPEAVKKAMGKDAEVHVSSNDEFEQTLQRIREGTKIDLEKQASQEQTKHRRKRRKIKE